MSQIIVFYSGKSIGSFWILLRNVSKGLKAYLRLTSTFQNFLFPFTIAPTNSLIATYYLDRSRGSVNDISLRIKLSF